MREEIENKFAVYQRRKLNGRLCFDCYSLNETAILSKVPPPPSSALLAANPVLLRSLQKVLIIRMQWEKDLVKFGIEDGHLANMVRAIEKLKLSSGK
ncbi:hypothetical protein HK098_006914, partial [Nowakowskiella sp. JEL0407]